ncbi:MAG: NAD(+)/NADH kinase [Planctomycetota bacterium]
MASRASRRKEQEGGARIRRVLILSIAAEPSVAEFAAELCPWLAARGVAVDFDGDARAFCRERAEAGARPDLVVVLGGDGAMLGAVRAFAADPVPVLGVHFGRVGFLASTTARRCEETLEGVLAGRGVLEERMRIEARWEADGEARAGVALNDVVVQRGTRRGLVTARLMVDEHWVTNYRADGVIVATPSGSTAYALAAGGPILEPAVEALVVTPICSVGLSNRPIVLHADGELSLAVVDTGGPINLAVDGQEHHPLPEGTVVRLRRHAVRYPIYVMPGLDPYRRLRSRLGWGLDWKAEEA